MTEFINIQLVIGSGLLLVLALLSFEKTFRKGEKSRLFLVAFLLVSALYLSALGLCYFIPQPFYSWADAIKIPLFLFVIPLFFLFVSGVVTGKPRPVNQILVHLAIPVAFLIAVPFIVLTAHLTGKLHHGSTLFSIWAGAGYLFLFGQTIIYTIRFFYQSEKYSKRLQDYYIAVPGANKNLRNLLIAFSGYFLFLDSWLMSFVIPVEIFPFVYSSLLFVFAGLIGWFGLNIEFKTQPSVNAVSSDKIDAEIVEEIKKDKPTVLIGASVDKPVKLTENDALLVSENELIEELDVDAETKSKAKRKLIKARKPFDELQKKELYKRMLNHLITNELYTDPKLTLKQLANDLGTNTRYLSMVINEYQGRNFNQMLNYYRVKKVMRLLVDNEAESYSYLGLAQKAGFHSKSVFISAFKSQTGTTPSEFSGTMKKLIKS